MADVDTIGPRCLVTGGCGYLGRALVQRLLSLGCEVHTLDLAEAAPDPRARHFRGDLRDFASIAPAFEGVQTVFHSAALIATVEERYAQPALRRTAYAVNVVGTENVVRAARAAGVKALVHVSSINVVMDHAIDGGDETLPYATQAPDLYSRTKTAAERVALAADQPGGLRVCAIRPGGIWGPGRGGMMLDAMVAELAKGTFKATIGDGKTPLDNTHVDNVVDAALLAARALRSRPGDVGGRAYFITDGERFDAMEWFRPLVEGLGHPFPKVRVPGALMLRVATGLEVAHTPRGPRAHHHAPLHPQPHRGRALLHRARAPRAGLRAAPAPRGPERPAARAAALPRQPAEERTSPMKKLVYILWAKRDVSPERVRTLLLDECAPALLARGARYLQCNIADERVGVKSPAPETPLSDEPFVAQVNLWLDDGVAREPFEDVLRGAGFDLAGYRVRESLYTEYGDNPHGQPRSWPDGERSPYIVAVTLLERPAHLAKEEWQRRWFGRQSPMSEAMQPRARYVRNVVEEALTPGAFPYEGIVEESWPSAEHVQNPFLFYGAKNPASSCCGTSLPCCRA
jgi:3beta-hydroxy-delta5-steroid dehydrogenase/steroid delta-isomerase